MRWSQSLINRALLQVENVEVEEASVSGKGKSQSLINRALLQVYVYPVKRGRESRNPLLTGHYCKSASEPLENQAIKILKKPSVTLQLIKQLKIKGFLANFRKSRLWS